MGKRPGLGILAKVPRAGEVKTRLLPVLDPAECALLAWVLLEDALRKGRDSGGPELARFLFLAGGEGEPQRAEGFRVLPQEGADLGERLDRALARMEEEGAGLRIVIGTDAPLLEAATIREAFRILDREDAVLVPAEDGGYVLVGESRRLPELFRGIEWGSERVAPQTRERARRAGIGLRELPLEVDLDLPADLHRTLLRLRERRGDPAPATRAFLEERFGRGTG